jgi:hypothetical protein
MKVIMAHGIIIQVPENPFSSVDVSPIWIRKYFETTFRSVINALNKVSTSIKHTFPYSSFSNKKMTPTTLTALVHKVEQRLGNMTFLVGQAAETAKSVQRDLRDNIW